MADQKRGRPPKVKLKYKVREGTAYDPNKQPVEYWLQTCKNPHTRYMYQVRFEAFEAFTKKDGKIMLLERIDDVASGDLRRAKTYDKLAVDFYEEMSKKYSSHTAWSYLTAVRSFFATFGKHMELVVDQYLGRAGKGKPQATKKKHKFILNELQDLCEVANWYERSILVLGVQSGLARNEVVALKVEEIKPWLSLEPPVGPIELVRSKTDTQIKMILGSDAVETLKTYIGNRREGWLFPSPQNFGKHITVAEPDRIIKRLWKRLPKDKYQPRGAIVYHALRDFFSNAMQNGGMPFQHVELLMGHQLPQGGAYTVPTDQMLKEEYMKAESNITLRRAPLNHERLHELEKKVERLEGALRTALTSGFEKRLTEEAVDDILKGEGLAERIKKKHPEWVAEY